jgi:hypothetical protein
MRYGDRRGRASGHRPSAPRHAPHALRRVLVDGPEVRPDRRRRKQGVEPGGRRAGRFRVRHRAHAARGPDSADRTADAQARQWAGFDDVVVFEPRTIADDAPNGLRELYVALTRATQQLYIVHSRGVLSLLEPEVESPPKPTASRFSMRRARRPWRVRQRMVIGSSLPRPLRSCVSSRRVPLVRSRNG